MVSERRPAEAEEALLVQLAGSYEPHADLRLVRHTVSPLENEVILERIWGKNCIKLLRRVDSVDYQLQLHKILCVPRRFAVS